MSKEMVSECCGARVIIVSYYFIEDYICSKCLKSIKPVEAKHIVSKIKIGEINDKRRKSS